MKTNMKSKRTNQLTIKWINQNGHTLKTAHILYSDDDFVITDGETSLILFMERH